MASLDDFKASPNGLAVGEILNHRDWQIEMVCLAKHGLTPAQAVGAEIQRRVGTLDDTQKQQVGRWIKEIMAEKGWIPDAKGARVAKGNLFSRATTYRQIQAAGVRNV